MNFCTKKVIRLDSKLLPFQIPISSLIMLYFSCHLTTVTHLSVFTLRIASACCAILRKNVLSEVFISLYIMGNITPTLNKKHFVITHSFLWCKYKKCDLIAEKGMGEAASLALWASQVILSTMDLSRWDSTLLSSSWRGPFAF